MKHWHYMDVFFVTFLTLFWAMALANTAFNYEPRDCVVVAPPEAVWAIPKTQDEIKQLQLAPLEKI